MHSARGGIPDVIFILIPVMLFAELFIIFPFISRVGGWHALAQRFRYDGPWSGRLWRFRSARFRSFTNYNGCLSIGVGDPGLYLKPLPIFGFYHPPLLIPWNEISYQTERGFLGDSTMLKLGSQEQIPCRVFRDMAVTIADAAQAHNCLKISQ